MQLTDAIQKLAVDFAALRAVVRDEVIRAAAKSVLGPTHTEEAYIDEVRRIRRALEKGEITG